MKKVLVTGANGFIGSHVVRVLLSRGYEVRGLIQADTDFRNLNRLDGEWFSGDLRDVDSLARAVKGCELIFHLAAYNNLWSPNRLLPHEVNVAGTCTLLRLAKQEGVKKFVYTGTATLFRPPKGLPATENDYLLRPPVHNAYEYSKYLAERSALECAQKDMEVISLAPTAPIGEGDVNLTSPGRLILDFLLRKLPVCLDTGMNVVDVEMLARAHVLAAERGRSGERYILGGRNITLREFFQVLTDLSGIPSPKFCIPYWFAFALSFTSEAVSDLITHKPPIAPLEGIRLARKPWYYDCEKAKRVLDLGETDLHLCLQKEVNWFQQNGYCS